MAGEESGWFDGDVPGRGRFSFSVAPDAENGNR